MSNKSNSLYEFLEEHKCNGNAVSTHTRIPNKDLGIYAGSYSICESDIPLFKNLYCEKVFQNKQQEYLTEAQLSIGGPILVDLDFRYDVEIIERQHEDTHLEDIIELYLKMLKRKRKKKKMNFPRDG